MIWLLVYLNTIGAMFAQPIRKLLGRSSRRKHSILAANLVGMNIRSNHLVVDGLNGWNSERDYAPEGAKRRYPAHFTSKLTDADGELQETQHWLMRAKAYGYIDAMSFETLWQQAKQVGRRLGAMMQSGDWS